jgi:hypothetical protein
VEQRKEEDNSLNMDEHSESANAGFTWRFQKYFEWVEKLHHSAIKCSWG